MIGDKIKTIRKKKKMTQCDLANKSNVTQTYISKLEIGDKKNPSYEALEKIAHALGVSVSTLLEETPEEDPQRETA